MRNGTQGYNPMMMLGESIELLGLEAETVQLKIEKEYKNNPPPEGYLDVAPLEAWWNPVDWAKGAADVVGNINDAVGILREQYAVMKQSYAQAQSTFMEIGTFWRGLIGSGGDIEARVKQLKLDKERHTKMFDEMIAKAPGFFKENVKNNKAAALRQDDAQIKGYQDVLDNIKKIKDGLWGPKSPFGMAQANFKDFQTKIEKMWGDFQKGFDGFVKQLSHTADGLTKSLTSIDKTSEATRKEIEKQVKQFTDMITKQTAQLKSMGDIFKGIQDSVTVQKDTFKGITDIQNTTKGNLDVAKGQLDFMKGQFADMKVTNVSAQKFYTDAGSFFENMSKSLKSIDGKLDLFKLPGV